MPNRALDKDKTIVANIIDGKLTNEMIEIVNSGKPIVFINHYNFKRDGMLMSIKI